MFLNKQNTLFFLNCFLKQPKSVLSLQTEYFKVPVLEQFTAAYPARIQDLEQLYLLIHQVFERRNREA